MSWYSAHLTLSLELIERFAPDRRSAIFEVGAGQSSILEDLAARGYADLAAIDLSRVALEALQARMGALAMRVQWLTADICTANLPPQHFDLWHDRAVFHFLTESSQRTAYAANAARAIKPGGHLMMQTFGPEGPLKCSGLETVRYDAEMLAAEFEDGFELREHGLDVHQTPSGATQQFLYAVLRRKS